jgi:tetratricopeptide (TPR) repeat protein
MKISLIKFSLVLICLSILACYSGSGVQSQNENPVPTQKNDISCEVRLAEARAVSIKEGSLNAINEYKSIIEKGCDTEESRMSLGLAMAGAKRFNEAAEQYRTVIKRNPKHWAAHWTLAQTLILELNQYDEGLKMVYKSKDLDNMGDIGYIYDFFIAKALDGLGDYKRASLHYQKYIKEQSHVWTKEPRLIEAKERLRVLNEK